MNRKERRKEFKKKLKVIYCNHRLFKIVSYDLAIELYTNFLWGTHNKFNTENEISYSDYRGTFSGYLDVIECCINDRKFADKQLDYYNPDFLNKIKRNIRKNKLNKIFTKI
jgi:hypothetical protein